MPHRDRFLPAFLSGVLTAALLGGCGGDGASAPSGSGSEVAWVEIHPGSKTLVFTGERYQLAATAHAAGGEMIPNLAVTWASADTAVAVVSTAGEVAARQDGRADVTATAAGVTGQVTITVDVSQAPSRCTGCHGTTGLHGTSMFPGATCPACHLSAFELGFWGDHQVPLPGHALVARGFELLGRHDTLSCGACHRSSGNASPRPDCYACHEDDYLRRHGGSGFPTTCQLCHTTAGFPGAVYPHEGEGAAFRLIGVHATFPCTRCHDATTGNPLYSAASEADCVACHLVDYQGRHAGSGYPTTCPVCHTTTPTQWLGATFDHATATGGRFTLLGTHLTRPCTVCHDATTGLPLFAPAGVNDCVTCHLADYQRKHAGSGFPTTCVLCHNPTVFSDVMFDHDADQFPIYIGTHAGRWTSCASCHTVASNFSQFSCLGCHDQTSTDAEHRDRTGYRYESVACLGCHPRP